jgi:outer membrane protein, multidrug efflux system
MKTHSLLPILALVVVSAGCVVGPDHHAPSSPTPVAYTAASVTNDATVPLEAWWTVFHDDRLDALIRDAAAANLDVRVAKSRVAEARALRGVAAAALAPSVDAGGDFSRSRTSRQGQNGRFASAARFPLENNLYDASLDASWEIDVFGGVRRSVEAAAAETAATEEAARDVRVTVLAEVGLAYLDLRGAQRQLDVARKNLAVQEDTLALTGDRFRSGLSGELDAARAAALVGTTKSEIPPLEERVSRSIHRLGVLTGRAPEALETGLSEVGPIPTAPPRVPVGLPSDLIRRRPDIRRAEREVAAANARVGVATADLFPKFRLTGAAGFQSLQASDFLSGGSRFWTLGPGVSWPVFSAGRIRQNIRAQNARHEQALLGYEQTVLTSLEEVENALVAFGREQDRRQALADAETAAVRAADLAKDRYTGGLVTYLDVLDAQRSVLAAQDALVQSDRRLSQDLIRLFKALGGGWADEPAALAAGQGPTSTNLK